MKVGIVQEKCEGLLEEIEIEDKEIIKKLVDRNQELEEMLKVEREEKEYFREKFSELSKMVEKSRVKEQERGEQEKVIECKVSEVSKRIQ